MRQILWPKVSTYPSVVDENLREEVLLFINERISIALLLQRARQRKTERQILLKGRKAKLTKEGIISFKLLNSPIALIRH